MKLRLLQPEELGGAGHGVCDRELPARHRQRISHVEPRLGRGYGLRGLQRKPGRVGRLGQDYVIPPTPQCQRRAQFLPAAFSRPSQFLLKFLGQLEALTLGNTRSAVREPRTEPVLGSPRRDVCRKNFLCQLNPLIS